MTTITRTALTITAAVAALTACGGSSTPAGPTYQTPQAIATKLGCTDYSGTTGGPNLFAAASGDCTYGGVDVELDTFATNTARDQACKVAKQFGAICVVGNLWSVDTHGKDAQAIATRLGGALNQ